MRVPPTARPMTPRIKHPTPQPTKDDPPHPPPPSLLDRSQLDAGEFGRAFVSFFRCEPARRMEASPLAIRARTDAEPFHTVALSLTPGLRRKGRHRSRSRFPAVYLLTT